MFGMRCDGCGEVRWSILGRPADKDVKCPACGEEMVPERRHPGHRAAAGEPRGLERRDAPAPTLTTDRAG